MRSLAQRGAAGAAAVLAALITFAGPAAAHGRGVESSNFVSTILEAPEVEGITWEVLGGDQYLQVTNSSSEPIIVPGYEDEPYLRVGPDGVEENQASRATYENKDRYAQVESIPADVGPEVEPRWLKVSSKPTYAWHDHRIHWMSPALPPVVQSDPGKATTVSQWIVPFQVGDQTYEVSGELRWVPGPSSLPWIGLGLLLTAPALLGIRRASGSNWVTAITRPAAVVLGIVAVLNITHLIDDFLAVPLPTGDVIQSAVQTGLFIALGIAGAVVAWRGRDGAFTALFIGSLAIFVGQGLLYLAPLRSSAAVSVFPTAMTRLVIALSLAQILPVGAAAFVGNRRLTPPADDEAPLTEGEVAAH